MLNIVMKFKNNVWTNKFKVAKYSEEVQIIVLNNFSGPVKVVDFMLNKVDCYF